MSEVQNPPVEEQGQASGKNPENDERPSYESFQKLLSEKKKVADTAKELKAKLDELLSEKKAKEEEDLKASSKWQEAYQLAKKELELKDTELKSIAEERLNAQKLRSFLDAVQGEVPKQYWGLIDIDKIQMEGDKVDEFSVAKYVETFKAQYTDIIKSKETRKMPADSPPAAQSGKLTYDQWMALPLRDREKRINDVKL